MRSILWAVLAVGALVSPAEQDWPEREPTQEIDPTELVNTLLGGLLGGLAVDGPTLQKEVEDAGGVPFLHDVPVAFLDPEQLSSYLEESFDEEYAPAEARRDERLLEAFGLLPAGTDLRALRARVLEENVVGFYDDRPGRKQLYAVSEDRTLTPMNQIVLAHELRHALQDQYADLHELVAGTSGDFDDRTLAALALFEGDATLVMERFLRLRLGALGSVSGGEGAVGETGFGALGAASLVGAVGAPPIVRDQLVQPYLVGLTFARALWSRGGADALREAWGRPPSSTEQVLHPELFLEREEPRSVVPRVVAPEDARPLGEGVLGELLIRTLLEQGSEAAAAGWGGDGWRLWDVAGRTALAWRSEWDSVEDADEFHEALVQMLLRRHGPSRVRGDDWLAFREEDGGRLYAVRRDDEGVCFVSADEARLLDVLVGIPAQESPGSPGAGEATTDNALDFGDGLTRVPSAGSDAQEPLDDPAEGGVMATSTPPSGGQTNLGVAPNVAGLLCYVPCCIGLIFSVVAAIVEKQSRFVRFHAFQSLLLHGAAIALGIVLQILTALFGVAGIGFLGLLVWVLMLVVGFGFLALTIVLMIKANAGQEMELPVIGPMARQWV